MTKTKKNWLKKGLITFVILAAIAAGIYWYIATEKHADTSEVKAAFNVSAIDFIREFVANENTANQKYTDKIITVSGTVSEIEPVDTTVNIKFVDTTSGSYVIFAFQEQHIMEAKSLKVGDSVAIKGSCSGGVFSEILGTESISFKRCAVVK